MLPELKNGIFHFVERPYNLRNKYTLERKRNYMICHGLENLCFLVPKLWELLINSVKHSMSFKGVKNKK